MMLTSLEEDLSASGKKPSAVITDRDIVFNCPSCRGELVVDREGAGLTVPCSHCGNDLVIPEYRAPSATPLVAARPGPELATAADPPTAEAVVARPKPTFDFTGQPREQLERRFNDLKGQLKENRSQDTEMRGHVNRATMELHRLQLKLRKLQDRQADIDAEINFLAEWLDAGAA